MIELSEILKLTENREIKWIRAIPKENQDSLKEFSAEYQQIKLCLKITKQASNYYNYSLVLTDKYNSVLEYKCAMKETPWDDFLISGDLTLWYLYERIYNSI